MPAAIIAWTRSDLSLRNLTLASYALGTPSTLRCSRRAAGANPGSSATATNTAMVRNQSMIIPDIGRICFRSGLFCPKVNAFTLRDWKQVGADAGHQGRESPSDRRGQPRRTVPDYPAVFLTDGTTMMTLWQAANPQTAVPFDRKDVVGEYRLALKVENVESLDALHRKLTTTDGVCGQGPLLDPEPAAPTLPDELPSSRARA